MALGFRYMLGGISQPLAGASALVVGCQHVQNKPHSPEKKVLPPSSQVGDAKRSSHIFWAGLLEDSDLLCLQTRS